MRAGAHRHADFETGVGGVHVHLPLRIALRVAGEALRRGAAAALAADGELPHACTVDAHVDLVRLAQADDVEIQLPPQDDLDRVLAVARKVMADRRAAL
jgi:hypothetical protein